MLMERVVKVEGQIESLRDIPWKSATMLVFRNEVRTKINNLSVFDHAIELNQSPIVIVATDQVRCHDIDNAGLRRFLLTLPDNKTEGLIGYLPIVPNMPIVVTHNIATELHISNGSMGRLINVVYEDKETINNNDGIRAPSFPWNTFYIRRPLYALVELPQSNLESPLNGLESTIVPIMPEIKQIKVDLKSYLSASQKRLLQNKTTITITRSQLPIIPAYAMTTHKSQGKTLTHGIIDLVPPPYAKPDLAQVYVPITRFTSLDKLAILRPFPRTVLNHKPHPDIVAELKRLQLLDHLGRESPMN
jgi:hypothetical protein